MPSTLGHALWIVTADGREGAVGNHVTGGRS